MLLFYNKKQKPRQGTHEAQGQRPPTPASSILPQPRAMMKTLSSGNCTLNVPAKNSYRMVVLGASRVGKSSIVSRFLNGRFEDQYTPTIEDFHREVYNIHGDMYQLDILDTSGNHPFPAMRRLSILTGEGLREWGSWLAPCCFICARRLCLGN